MIRSPRKKIPLKKFSPSQLTNFSQENYLLRFEDNDELIVVHRSSIRSIIEDKAVIGIGLKRRFATIQAKGTYSQCNNMYEQLKSQEEMYADNQEGAMNESMDCQTDNGTNEDCDESDQENQDEIPTNSSSSNKRKSPASKDNDTDEDSNYDAITTQRDTSTKKKPRLSSQIFLSNENNVLTNRAKKQTENVEGLHAYQTIDDMHDKILKKLEKKFSIFSKKLDQMIPHALNQNLEFYREKDENFPNQVLYNGKDLLITRGRDIYDFSRKILRILYTPVELSTSILPPARKHLSRPPLDPDRFDLFHEAVRVKYRIAKLHYDNCYAKLIRPKICDFLIDERKRQAKLSKQQSMDNPELNQIMN